MIKNRKPKIGLLGIMIEGYEPIFPGIIKNQEKYVRENLIPTISDIAEIDFPGPACNRKAIEETVRHFNQSGCDGIMIVLLAYSHATWIVRAMQDNRLPLALAVLQPSDAMTEKFVEYDFTINQGIHGAQDNANALMRLGVPCQFFVGSRHGEEFRSFFTDFSTASFVYSSLRGMRCAVIGKMTGMGDLFTDDVNLYAKMGPEFCYVSIGEIYKRMQEVSESEILAEMEKEKAIFNVDKNMPEEAFKYAIRQYLAMKKFLEEGDYDAFTLHFETLGEDGRFESLPFLAASHLLADGYGYAAEGDALCACAVKVAHLISGNANFSEMYALDYPTRSILMCHAGEGNYLTARKDRKPDLIYKVFNEGGLKNPPTTLFTPEPGVATIASFAPDNNGFRIAVSKGEITDRCDLKGCEMPYIFFKPNNKMETLVEKWLQFGATHHETVMYGDRVRVLKMLASMWKCDFIEL